MQVELDIKENILVRVRQRAYLARYGRQDMFARRSLVELNRAVSALSEVVQKENELSRAQEDH
jgi:hypothetical protein